MFEGSHDAAQVACTGPWGGLIVRGFWRSSRWVDGVSRERDHAQRVAVRVHEPHFEAAPVLMNKHHRPDVSGLKAQFVLRRLEHDAIEFVDRQSLRS